MKHIFFFVYRRELQRIHVSDLYVELFKLKSRLEDATALRRLIGVLRLLNSQEGLDMKIFGFFVGKVPLLFVF